MTDRIKILMAKYCSDKLSDNETQELITWIETRKNKVAFNDYIALNFTIEQLKSEDRDDTVLWEHIKASFKVPKRKINYWKYAAAASVLLIVALTIFINKDRDAELIKGDTTVIVDNNIKIGSDKAILTTETGNDIVLEEGKQYLDDNVISDGEKIVYKDAEESPTAEVAYNYLTVPRGGQFYIELSDNTKVWLNSDSKIKYPKIFIANQDREVELIYGEAYFDISPSTENNGAKFRVLNQSQEVEVLGTEFNIKAYKDETNIYTTLVEGKVAVSFENAKRNLVPGQQFDYNLNTSEIVLREVDVYNEISWKEGVFSFERKSLKEIMKVLSRWYDFEVIFETEDIQNKKFIGILDKEQNIEDILMSIKGYGNINDYVIKDKSIILK